MTKLEKKLIELGYENKLIGLYKKDFGCIEICIYVNPNYTQPTQQAFNQLQKDLEVLKNIDTKRKSNVIPIEEVMPNPNSINADDYEWD